MTGEITAQALVPESFIAEKMAEIRATVGDGWASFAENRLMRAGEAEQVVGFFRDRGMTVICWPEVYGGRQMRLSCERWKRGWLPRKDSNLD